MIILGGASSKPCLHVTLSASALLGLWCCLAQYHNQAAIFLPHRDTTVSTHLLDQDSDLASGMAELESSWFPGVVCLCFLRLCFVAQTTRATGWKITQQLAAGAGHYKHRASNWYWRVKAAIRLWLLQGKKLKYLSFCYCLIITSNCYVLGWVMKKCLLKKAVIKKYITPIWKSIR